MRRVDVGDEQFADHRVGIVPQGVLPLLPVLGVLPTVGVLLEECLGAFCKRLALGRVGGALLVLAPLALAFLLLRLQRVDAVLDQLALLACPLARLVERERVQRTKSHPALDTVALVAQQPRAIVGVDDLQIQTVAVGIASRFGQTFDPLDGKMALVRWHWCEKPTPRLTVRPPGDCGDYRALAGRLQEGRVEKCPSLLMLAVLSGAHRVGRSGHPLRSLTSKTQ